MAEPAGEIEIDLRAIVETFLAEGAERLSAMEQALVELESCPDDADALHTIFRVAHTIKGNAGMVGFPAVVEFTHTLEDVLSALRSRLLPVTPALVTDLLGAVDILRVMLPAAAAGEQKLEPAAAELLARLRAVRAGAGPAAAAPSPVALPPERRGGKGRRHESLDAERTHRVGIALLDRMMNLTGEIAIANGRLRRALAGEAGAAETHAEAERLFTDLQELVMQARLVPLGPVFRRQARTVRDAAHARGKLVRLLIEGENVEVDTSVVDHMSDPLTHLVRNAIDHGIESPAARTAAGKDPSGTVTLRAAHEGGSIVLEVADDGCGLDRVRILARAREAGLVSEGAQPPDAEVNRLIFEPGFSTAETVTEISGRGVGLDVVRKNVVALRGTVGVATAPGRGTTVTLRLPLTLAVIAGLNVAAGGESYVVPLEAVVECLGLSPGEGPHEDGRGVVNVRGISLPYVSLSALFGRDGATQREIVVVRTEEGTAGLAVDAVRGEGQTVVKPLGGLFSRVPFVSGASVQGDGRIALILDAAAIVKSERSRPGAQPPGRDAEKPS